MKIITLNVFPLVFCQTRPVVVAYLLSKSNDNPKRCFPNGSPVWRYLDVSPVIVYAPVVVFWSQDKSALLLRKFRCFLFKIGKYICQSLSVWFVEVPLFQSWFVKKWLYYNPQNCIYIPGKIMIKIWIWVILWSNKPNYVTNNIEIQYINQSWFIDSCINLANHG